MSVLSPELIEELRAEFQTPTHRTVRQIADLLGVSKNTIAGALDREGIKSCRTKQGGRRALVGTKDEEIVDALNEGKSMEGAARLLGCSHQSLGRVCDERGIDRIAILNASRVKIFVEPAMRDQDAYIPMPRRGMQSLRRGFFRSQQKKASPDLVAELRRLADEAIAEGRITYLPAAHASGSISMSWERIL